MKKSSERLICGIANTREKFHSQLHQRRIEEFEALYHFSEKNTLPSDPTVADASAEQQTSESTDTATAIAASTLPTDLTDTQR